MSDIFLNILMGLKAMKWVWLVIAGYILAFWIDVGYGVFYSIVMLLAVFINGIYMIGQIERRSK